jgi:hypothetical protein
MRQTISWFMFARQPVIASLLSAAQGGANPLVNRGLNIMKAILTVALGGVLLAAIPVEANAVVCAKGVYRAGCAGAHGAVVTHRPVAAGCYYRAGVRVCR